MAQCFSCTQYTICPLITIEVHLEDILWCWRDTYAKCVNFLTFSSFQYSETCMYIKITLGTNKISYGPYQLCFVLLQSRSSYMYCRHAGVRPSPVDVLFSNTTEWIDAIFWGQVPIHHISRPFFFVCVQNLKFLIFYLYTCMTWAKFFS